MREEEKFTSQGSKWRKALRKRWVLPAVYIGSAALLIIGVLSFQLFGGSDEIAENGANGDEIVDNQAQGYADQEAVPVTASEENFKMPVLDENAVTIKKQFYDNDASSEEQEAALVFYNNTYYPSTGIDIAMESGDSFDVVSSLSGTVVRAENDSLLGNVVEIEHEDGIATFYQSLDEVHVEAGAYVDQGEVIGTAGTSVYNKDAGTHVHFEIRSNNEPINPIEFFNKPLSSVKEEQEAKPETEAAEGEDTNQAAEESEEQPKEESAEESEQPAAEESSEQPAEDEEENAEEPSEGEENTDSEENAPVSMTSA